jgi:cytochrome o ubiquinol oxidase subunit 3
MNDNSLVNPIDHAAKDKTVFGFWVYLMTDCLLFGSLFATYAVLHNNTFGGLGGADLFSMPVALAETLILLTSSFSCGLAMLAVQSGRRRHALLWFGLTALLGLTFLTFEISEFAQLVADGDSWARSGFLSGFFTLVGTHGLHIIIGLLWLGVLGWQIIHRGFTKHVVRRLTLFSMFWHFLDVIWIFIFTVVYLIGALRI